MALANRGSAPSYGDDEWTQRASDAFRALFETDCEVFFVFNGTAANSLALASLCQSYHSVICSSVAHIGTDECGAPEFFSNGSKLLVAPSSAGKLTPDAVRTVAISRSDIHFPKPRVVTITQPTETGQVYTADEIRAVSAACRELGLKVHMDGARFAHACATLGCAPADITWRAGVDVLCFGGTKNGLAVGEAVLFFDKALAQDFDYRCKQAGQLASKMRFLAAPWIGLLESGAWLRNARHANACAMRLASAIDRLPGVEPMFPVEANAVFRTRRPPGAGMALLYLYRRGRPLHVRLGCGRCARRPAGGGHSRRGGGDARQRVTGAALSKPCRRQLCRRPSRAGAAVAAAAQGRITAARKATGASACRSRADGRAA